MDTDKTSSQQEQEGRVGQKIPCHVGIIMDGNGRWAAEKGVSRIEGHRAGADAAQRIVEACRDAGVKYLTLYAFSTENWRRPSSEVKQLMSLLQSFLTDRMDELQQNGIRLKTIGRVEDLPRPVKTALNRAVEMTKNNEQGTLVLALNYGGRQEIIEAAKTVAQKVEKGELSSDEITEHVFEQYLYTAGIPDPDLIIRTSGEQRLSNFLTWQCAYAEFWFSATYWPDFTKDEFQQAIAAYSRRQRRFGGRSDAS